jgi:hypothetical protein
MDVLFIVHFLDTKKNIFASNRIYMSSDEIIIKNNRLVEKTDFMILQKKKEID